MGDAGHGLVKVEFVDFVRAIHHVAGNEDRISLFTVFCGTPLKIVAIQKRFVRIEAVLGQCTQIEDTESETVSSEEIICSTVLVGDHLAQWLCIIQACVSEDRLVRRRHQGISGRKTIFAIDLSLEVLDQQGITIRKAPFILRSLIFFTEEDLELFVVLFRIFCRKCDILHTKIPALQRIGKPPPFCQIRIKPV